MIGITSYGAYIPTFRLSRDMIAKAWGRGSLGGERAVANNDEDSTTMAVGAVFDCLQGQNRRDIQGLFFASTTAPYSEKQISPIVAKTVDLGNEILTYDFANGLRAGTSALRAAIDTVGNGSATNILSVAADCRLAYPQSDAEQAFGDGAAALMVGNSKVIASFEGHYALANEMMDVWRKTEDTFVQTWEGRWVLGEGYSKLITKAISGLLNKKGIDPKSVSWLALPAPNLRSHRQIAQSLGFDMKTQAVDPLLANIGDCGAAHPLMILVSALERAKSGDTILLASYGDGAEAFLFKVTDEIVQMKKRRGIEGYLNTGIPLATYEKYLSYRNLLESKPGEPFRLLPSATSYWRDQNSILSFHGSKCRNCGTVGFPIQRVCYTCLAKDDFDEIRLSDKLGQVFTYSIDNLAGRSDDPVVVQTMVETEEDKARVYCMMTDCRPEEIRVGMPVEFTFRKIYEGAGFHNYFWKCRPLRRGGK
ncbi:MAG: hydroxymethylglutaryl-CoA synthase family protein [Deltaproteobacteria bacterium]|nr:hydroxymethylglutaryl-CoA synthase family protein [Deltaproteobacteria bacterium]